MSYLINNQQNLNEIIFAKRNKNYGAYAIRSAYGSTIFKSLTIMAFGFGSFMALAYYFSNRNNAPKQETLPFIQDSIYVVEVDNRIKENKLKTVDPPSDAPSGKKGETQSTTIADTTSVETTSVEIDHTTASTGTGSTTTEVPTTGGTGTTSLATNTSSGSGEVAEPFGVDTQPEFEGGLNALRRFVADRIHYPAIALEEGKGGTLYVKFVVDEKGKVSNLSLLNNLGYGLDQEALRVVGLIPNFTKPATVRGQPVKVYYQLPIKFTVAK